MNNIEYFFNPKTVAVVGATSKKKVGGIVLEQFLDKKFKGKVFPVNPKYKKIGSKKCSR